MKQKEKVYLYIFKTKNTEKNEKIKSEIDKYLKKFNFTVRKEFNDTSKTEEKGLIDMMNYASIEKDVFKVVAHSRSNISGDDIFVMWMEKEILKNNAIIKYVKTESLKNSEIELLREKVIGAFARYEKSKLPNKLAAHREYKSFETGIKSSGNCPLGYRYFGKTSADKLVIVVDREVDMVNEIFEKYIEFRSLGKLMHYLDDKGTRTRRNKKFSRQALYNILTNKFYIGILSYNQYKYITVNNNKKKKPILIEERRIDGKHQKIIDVKIFEKAGKILKSNNKHKND